MALHRLTCSRENYRIRRFAASYSETERDLRVAFSCRADGDT